MITLMNGYILGEGSEIHSLTYREDPTEYTENIVETPLFEADKVITEDGLELRFGGLSSVTQWVTELSFHDSTGDLHAFYNVPNGGIYEFYHNTTRIVGASHAPVTAALVVTGFRAANETTGFGERYFLTGSGSNIYGNHPFYYRVTDSSGKVTQISDSTSLANIAIPLRKTTVSRRVKRYRVIETVT